MIKVGCCGFPIKMGEYFEKFKLVEIQKTFYSPPKIKIAGKWRSAAPADFEFTVKAWQVITHPSSSPTYRKAGIKISKGKEDKYGFFKPTEEVFDAWEKTKQVCRALNSRIVIFQCPASFKPSEENIENMKIFFNVIERGDLKFAWEPRGEWGRELLKELCKELNLIHCVDPFISMPAYGGTAYFRLHGRYEEGRINYNHRYSDSELKELVKKCKGEVYCLFNNLSMLDSALKFQRLLQHPRSPSSLQVL